MGMPSMSGRGWAYIGAGLGGCVSIAANVAHSYVPPAVPQGALPLPADWTPPVGAVVGAIFWPVALFVATEILARVAWPTGKRWTTLRFAGLLPVSLVAAFVSYRHLSGLLDFYGEDSLTTMVGPLAVDGLMVMATGALLATASRLHAAPAAAPATLAPAAPAAPSVTAPALDEPAAQVSPPPVKRPARPKVTTAERVARHLAKYPDATQEQVAARLKVTVRTVQRYWPSREATVTSLPAAA